MNSRKQVCEHGDCMIHRDMMLGEQPYQFWYCPAHDKTAQQAEAMRQTMIDVSCELADLGSMLESLVRHEIPARPEGVLEVIRKCQTKLAAHWMK